MKRLLPRRPSPALVVACIALFVALGPAAYAMHEVIDSSDVVDGSLQGIDVKNSSLTGADVADSSLSGADVRGRAATPTSPAVDGSLTGFDVQDGSLGGADIDEALLGVVPDANALDGLDSTAFLRVTGKAADANLLDGADSTAFLRSAIYVRDKSTRGLDPPEDTVCNGNELCREWVDCDPGDLLLTGGFLAIDSGTFVVSNAPIGQRWFVAWQNNSTPDDVVLRVVCANQP